MCVELQPQFLLLCAVLQSAELAEAEGALASDSRAGRTLAVLRSMLAPWADDASRRCRPTPPPPPLPVPRQCMHAAPHKLCCLISRVAMCFVQAVGQVVTRLSGLQEYRRRG